MTPAERTELLRLRCRMLRKIGQASRLFKMFRTGDRVAAAVSGGIDSLSMLELLKEHSRTCPTRYKPVIIHIAGDGRGPAPADAKLRERFERSGLEFEIAEMALPPDEKLPMDCARCAWNRRKAVFLAAERLNCRVVAFAHHADDFAQTTLMNLLHQGRIGTIHPASDFFDGALRVVRPLVFVTRGTIERYAGLAGIEPTAGDCPNEGNSERDTARRLMNDLEAHSRDLTRNLLRAGLAGVGALPDDRLPRLL